MQVTPLSDNQILKDFLNKEESKAKLEPAPFNLVEDEDEDFSAPDFDDIFQQQPSQKDLRINTKELQGFDSAEY